MSKQSHNSFLKTTTKSKTKPFVSFVILIILIAVTFFAWKTTDNYVNYNRQEKFNDAVREIIIRTEDVINTYIDIILGARGLFSASESVERNEWQAYTNSLNLEQTLPGMQALSFIERVSHEEKDNFINLVRSDTSISADGYPNFTINPPGEREEYFVVNYIEPFQGNEAAFGFDLFSNPARKTALKKSQDTGLPIATAPIKLVQEKGKQAGFLMFLPIYKKNVPSTTPKERQEALEGFISAVFRAEDLLAEILSNVSAAKGVYIEIFDNLTDPELTEESKLYKYERGNISYRPRFSSDEKIVVAGRKWNMHFEDLPAFDVERENKILPWLVLLGGLLFSLFIFALMYSFSRTKLRAMQLAQELTVDLKKFQLAVENASDHIIITDPDSIIIYANKAVEKITGFSRKETIGKKSGQLWGGHMDKEFYQSMWKTIKEDRKPFFSELKNKRKNGEKYDVQLKISPVLNERGNVLFFVGIERDITKEKEIDRAKTEFVSLASHQLRTPLTSVNWYTEMLLSGDAGKLTKDQNQFVNEIYKGNQRMIDLVNALLNVSRIDLGTFAIEPEPTNIVEIADSVLEELKSQILRKQMNIEKRYDKGIPIIKADSKLIRIIFQNLLSNAVKYTPDKGKVILGIAKQDKDLLIKVVDTGYGIPKDQQVKIFSKLFRADNIQQKDVEGNGLGLYIVKSIIDKTGGKIWFESEENKGTTFYATLPLKGMKKKQGAKGLS